MSTPSSQELNSRAIVVYEGEDTGDGVWSCSKDQRGLCTHIGDARTHLQHILGINKEAWNETLPEHNATEIGTYKYQI